MKCSNGFYFPDRESLAREINRVKVYPDLSAELIADEIFNNKENNARISAAMIDVTNGLTMNQLAERNDEHVATIAALEARCAALVAENAALKSAKEIIRHLNANREEANFCGIDDCHIDDAVEAMLTPATDAFLTEVRAQAHKEGAYFVANRMLAAWDAGFIDDTAKNAADIARMILTSTEFMADAPEGDFDRSFADGVLEGIAAQLRKGVQS